MKRYLLSIVLGAFAVLAIGAYYSLGSSAGMPQYRLATVEGDAAEGASIRLDGSYVGGVGSKALSITGEGTSYNLQSSVYKKHFNNNRYLTNRYAEFAELKREHRGFMRGKSIENGFYQDEEWLVYADVKIYRNDKRQWEIVTTLEALDKSAGKTEKYRHVAEGSADNHWIVVHDVQRVDDEIHILSQRHGQNRASQDELGSFEDFHVDVFDVKSGERVRGGKINLQLERERGTALRLSTVPAMTRSAPSDVILLRATSYQRTENRNGSYAELPVSEQLFVYHYRTGEIAPVPELHSLSGEALNNSQYDLDGDRIVHVIRDKKQLTVSAYRLSTGQTEQGVVEWTADQLGWETIHSAVIENDRIYVFIGRETRQSADVAAVVLNAANGDVLYKGRAEFVGPEAEAATAMNELWIRGLYVRD
ncbi:hypothetical protein ACF3MZ_09750 [Paenibacillaceae bacterium WGS1546]|uniref:hypothetical protein n=1 Tax=Cohnella sp. WGS1546 TaxID=3366810 RepID=UPI00372D6003